MLLLLQLLLLLLMLMLLSPLNVNAIATAKWNNVMLSMLEFGAGLALLTLFLEMQLHIG